MLKQSCKTPKISTCLKGKMFRLEYCIYRLYQQNQLVHLEFKWSICVQVNVVIAEHRLLQLLGDKP